MITPRIAFNKIKALVKPCHIQAFLAALITGIIAHGYVIANYIPNWDGFNNLYDPQNKLALGRCFLTLGCGISSYYDLPWLSGILSLLYISITAVILTDLFELKRKISCILTGAVLAAFPACTSIFGYSYTSDGYFLAMLLMALAARLCIHKKNGILRCIPAAALVCFALGCYQAFISFGLTILIVWAIKQLLFEREEHGMKQLLLTFRNAVISFGVGFVLYFICNKLLQGISGVSPADYQGISDLGSGGFSLSQVAHGFVSCIVDFAYFMLGSISKLSLYGILNIIILLLLCVCLVWTIVRERIYKSPLRLILTIVLTMMIPFSCFAVNFISAGVEYHSLMVMAVCLIYILLLIFYEKNGAPLLQWTIIVLMSVYLWNAIVIANICYRVEETSVTRSQIVLDDIAGLLAETGEADSATNLIVIGNWDENETGRFHSSSSIYLPPVMTGFTDGIVMTGPIHFTNLFRDYYGYDYRMLSEATTMEFTSVHEKEIADMPQYPQKGSVAIIDHVAIIKLSNELQ